MRSSNREIILLTGLSGAGKSSALNVLEDSGYFAIDNFPAELLPALTRLLGTQRTPKHYRRMALVMDARGVEFVRNFEQCLQTLKQPYLKTRILFLESRSSALIRRFSETRRKHPLSPAGSILTGIRRERELLSRIRLLATQTIDTSGLSVHELRALVLAFAHQTREKGRFVVNLISFGYRFGLPLDADLVLDLRFLPNPYFVPRLRPLAGNDRRIQRYLSSRRETAKFEKILKKTLRFLLKNYQREGKSYVTLAFGCTGGRHRSVAIAERVASWLKRWGYPFNIRHRDVDKGD